jgi:hypothetical protein
MQAPLGTIRPWTAEEDADLRAHMAGEGTLRGFAERCGRSYDSVKNRWARAGGRHPIAIHEDESAITSPLNARPVTLDELLATFGIPADEWDVVECTPNIWQVGSAHPETGEILSAPLYQLKARLKRKAPASVEKLVAALLDDIRQDTATRVRVRHKPAPVTLGDPHALEIDLFDLHVGKMAWLPETGSNYDSRLADEAARAALADLIAQAAPYPVDQIILPIGNDFFHSDTLAGTTTAGTVMDRDTRFHLMFRRGRALAEWMVERCAEVAPVLVPVIPGNHDELTSFLLGEVLGAVFAHDPRVTVDNGPALRKYYRYGRNFIGWSHGNGEPHAKLPQIMAVERPDDWAASVCREFHVGHLHKSKTVQPVTVDDQTGVTVRIIRSLSGTDAWHARNGYVGGTRGAEAFVYRRSGGLRAHLYHTAEKHEQPEAA